MGCPQGSPLSPSMWKVLISTLVIEILPEGVHIQAFAEDVKILVKGQTRRELEFKARRNLDMVDTWSIKYKVRFKPLKSLFLLLGNA